jgi:hypothetical protein
MTAVVQFLPCVAIFGDPNNRRVLWINPSAISHFSETGPWPQARGWTRVWMTNGEPLRIDAPAAQFAGWLRGDLPQFSEEDYEAYAADRGRA